MRRRLKNLLLFAAPILLVFGGFQIKDWYQEKDIIENKYYQNLKEGRLVKRDVTLNEKRPQYILTREDKERFEDARWNAGAIEIYLTEHGASKGYHKIKYKEFFRQYQDPTAIRRLELNESYNDEPDLTIDMDLFGKSFRTYIDEGVDGILDKVVYYDYSTKRKSQSFDNPTMDEQKEYEYLLEKIVEDIDNNELDDLKLPEGAEIKLAPPEEEEGYFY